MTKRATEDVVGRLVERHGFVRTGDLAAELGISRQAAHVRLHRLVARGVLVRQGAGRSTGYHPAPPQGKAFRFQCKGLDARDALRQVAAKASPFGALPWPGADRIAWALNELLTNASAHSGADVVEVRVRSAGPALRLEVSDDGRGAFETLRSRLRLRAPLDAARALAVGCLAGRADERATSLPVASRLGAGFELESGGIRWAVESDGRPTVHAVPERRGTRVRFDVDPRDARPLDELLARLAPGRPAAGGRLVVPVREITPSSRATARRLLFGTALFDEVVLDFDGRSATDLDFPDEIFRVFADAHPNLRLTVVHAGAAVEGVIRRVQRAGRGRSR